jgi:hypothetical protein
MDETLLTCSVCFFIYTCFLLIGSLCSIIDTVEYMYGLFALGMPMFVCYVFRFETEWNCTTHIANQHMNG